MNNNLFWMLTVSFVAGFVPAYLPFLLEGLLNEKALRWLTGLAAGILLAAALLIAIPEGFEIVAQNMELSSEHHSEEHHDVDEHIEGDDVTSIQITNVMSWAGPGVMVLAGFLVMMMIESLGVGHSIHEEHHNHEGDYGHAHVHHPRSLSGVVAIGLTVHALTDGVAIGAGMATDALDVAVPQLFGVVFHKIPAAFSLGVFGLHEVRQFRATMRSTLFYILLFAIATPAALYFSWYGLGNMNELSTGVVLLFSAGTFLYVATVDFLPNIHDPSTGRGALLQIVVATVIMLIVVFLIDFYGLAAHSH
ncbi:MAG TPA: ZIP family metal transporter [Anaerolineales bacterium]|nr:ZIP family metal transporter [Anaerolineales bacterium]|tara:strand:+ start:13820 stop:14737 length:918 start_codon:yes stop_codon:yes gene_type:complete